jgi:signal transduction histidine kinase
MEAMQQFALASGIAIGGLLGAAAAAILIRRAHARDARQLAELVAAGMPPAPDASDPLSPLRSAMARSVASLRATRDQHDAQRRQLSAEMVRLMNQSEGAIRAKDRFVAAISHDLRQPLQSMGLALERLHRTALPTHAHDLRQVRAGMRTLTELLDGLLLLSQLEAGALQAQAAACDLHALFAEVLAAQADRARAAGVTLHAHAGAHAACTDARLLAGLLGRLLDNAIKSSPRGGRVLLAARRQGGGLRIEVRDGGVGIAPIHQPRVFDEFFQIGNPERDHRKGFGLGLSVASRLAALLGTRIQLHSRLRAGTCFWLALPRASVLQRPPRAVLLDADPAQRDALAAMLKSWGYALHAEAAVDAACARVGGSGGPVDAVLCAVDGDDDPAWALIRNTAAQQPQAVRIVLCAAPGPALLEIAARHGAQALSRPPAPSKLRSLLAQRPLHALRGAA